MTNRPVSVAHLREEIGRILLRDYPEHVNLADLLPDDLLEDFYMRLTLSPSGLFLDFAQRSLEGSDRKAGEIRFRNLVSVLPAISEPAAGETEIHALRARSAALSLTVTVVEEMNESLLGSFFSSALSEGEINWVRGVAMVARGLPDMWHLLSTNERLLIAMSLAGKQGNVTRLIELCRERDTLSPDFVKAFFENSSAPLDDGVL